MGVDRGMFHLFTKFMKYHSELNCNLRLYHAECVSTDRNAVAGLPEDKLSNREQYCRERVYRSRVGGAGRGVGPTGDRATSIGKHRSRFPGTVAE